MLMTVKDYAERIATPESTVREYARKGIFKAVKIGKGWKLYVDECDAALGQLHASSRAVKKPCRNKITNWNFKVASLKEELMNV